MRLILVAFVTFIIVGCGLQPPVFQLNQFQAYYDTFVANTGVTTNNLVIQFGTINLSSPTGEVVGECTIGLATPTITIDQQFWSTADEGLRQELIDHELGHCVLSRVHRFDLLPNGYPASIMYPSLFNPSAISANQQYYYNELIGKQ